MAYFDNAATTYPKPAAVYNFMDKFYRNFGANVGRGDYNIAKTANEVVEETRNLLKELLQCPTKETVFTPSATIALNIIIQGLIQDGARNIYISPFEHNAVTRILYHYESLKVINVYQLTVTAELEYDLERIKYQFDNVRPDLVIVSHASNVIGLVAPIEKIFKTAKKYNAYTLADMSQTAGLVECNVGLSTFDFAVFAGHKTLYAPTGIAGFVMNPDINFSNILFGGTGIFSAEQTMPSTLPNRYEMGTLNISGIGGLNAALKWNKATGIHQIYDKDIENRKRLLEIFNQYSWIKIIGNNERQKYVGIVSILIDGFSSDSMGLVFNEHGIAVRSGLQCAPVAHKFLGTFPSGTIRFSVGYFTSDIDYNELQDALDAIEGEM